MPWIEKCSLKSIYPSKEHQWEHPLHHFKIRKRQENPLPVPSSQASKLYQYRQGNCRRHYHKIQIHL
jgi:hypothetical protein